MPMCFRHRGRKASSAPWPYTLPMAFEMATEVASSATAAALNSPSPPPSAPPAAAEGGAGGRGGKVDVLLEQRVEGGAEPRRLGAGGGHRRHGVTLLRLCPRDGLSDVHGQDRRGRDGSHDARDDTLHGSLSSG